MVGLPSDQPRGAIWPAEDDGSALIREVYARYGLAMYKASVLEHGMANTLLVLDFLPRHETDDDRSAWNDAYDKFWDATFKLTFGNLVKALEAVRLPPPLIARGRQAKDIRDELAHRFFRNRAEEFINDTGRRNMIGYCEDAIEAFDQLDTDLEALNQPLYDRYGLTREVIDAEYEAAYRRASQS